MRGQTGIVYVIDGIRRTSADFNGLDPNEIESVSILKDASAVAVYGLDANGVFIVTTKQGKAEKMSITYTGSVGFSQNAEQQEWLDGPGYAYWYNKARELQGDSQVFTAEMVQKMRDGVDGWGNTNWYDKVYGTGTRTHHNISATGGSDRVRFFASIGYLNEDGNIDNYGYNRLNLRSNIDAKLTKSLTFTLGVSGRIEKEIRRAILPIRMPGIMFRNKSFVPCLMCLTLMNMKEKHIMYPLRRLPLRWLRWHLSMNPDTANPTIPIFSPISV